MSSAAPSYSSVFRNCIKDAAAMGRELMQRTIVRALAAMPVKAAQSIDVVERNLLPDAVRVLAQQEAALIEAYPQALLGEFAHAIAGDVRKAAAVSFDQLELMGEDQVQESVELVRTQQLVLSAVEAELSELNRMVCAAQGLKTVQAERNPLRPDVYVRALRTVVQQSPVSASVRRRWLLHLGEALGPELAIVYRTLSGMLRSQGVAAAGFTVTAATAPALSGAPAAAPAPPAPADAGAQLNVHELRRLLAGDFEAEAAAAAAPAGAGGDFSMTVPAAFEALQEMRQVEQVMQRLRQRHEVMPGQPGSGMAALREMVKKEAPGPGRALGVEVVGLMVENLASDPRLLPAVQRAVRELEPALMRLALADPRFFSDRHHPARQLLEEMTQRSLAWADETAPGFPAFIEPLKQAVEALVETGVPGPEPFAFALQSLRDAWGDLQSRDRRQREKAVRALLQAEQRNLLAGKLAGQMRERADMPAAPPVVQQFITGPWCQVMAQARLGDATGAPDPGGWLMVVGDLLWSVLPGLAAANPARLVRLVPGLVQRLRRGLESIDYPPVQAERFLQQLAGLHEQILRPQQAATARPAALSTSLSRDQLEAMFADPAGNDAWLAPEEARNSGFMPTDIGAGAVPLFAATQPAAGAALPAEEMALPDIGLAPGSWVELFADGSWERWQLTWSSPHGTLHMFTHGSGRTQSMTRRLAQKMLDAGTLRLVSAQAVVDGALDAVAQAALRNSLDLKL